MTISGTRRVAGISLTGPLSRFDPPGFLDDFNEQQRVAWSQFISEAFDAAALGDPDKLDFDGPREQLYNPTRMHVGIDNATDGCATKAKKAIESILIKFCEKVVKRPSRSTGNASGEASWASQQPAASFSRTTIQTWVMSLLHSVVQERLRTV